MLELPDLLMPEVNVAGDSVAEIDFLKRSTDESLALSKMSRVVSPEVNCHHVSIAGKNYLSIKVSNVNSCPVILKEAQVLVNKNELHQSNPKLLDTISEGKTAKDLSEAVDKVSVKISLSQLQQMPFSLLRHEEFVFLCSIELQSAQISIVKFQKIKIPLLFALTFQTDMDGSQASMRAQYTLPKLRLQSPALVMFTECSSPVKVNQSFTVTYTIQNNLQDFMGIILAWIPSMPSHDASADKKRHAAINEALVCQQPVTDVGICRKGSTVSVKVDFQALSTGVHEVGKLMKLKLQYAIPSPDPLGVGAASSAGPSNRTSMMTTSPSATGGFPPPPLSPLLSSPGYSRHAPLSTTSSYKYDVPVVEQRKIDLPPFTRYLSQSQIKSLQQMKPRQRLSARSLSYGGEVTTEREKENVKRQTVMRQLSGCSASSFQRSRRVSYAGRIVKHPCQVYVVKEGQL